MDAYLRLIEVYDIQNTQLYCCKYVIVIVGDRPAAPYSLPHAAYQGMIPKGKLGWFR